MRGPVSVWLWICLMPVLPEAGQAQNTAVAIVSGLQGSAEVMIPGKAPRALRLFEWLETGASVKVHPASIVVLAFAGDTVRERALIKEHLNRRGDPESLALMAAIDSGLGLLLEARNGFMAALAKTDNPEIRAIVKELDRQIGSGSEDKK